MLMFGTGSSKYSYLFLSQTSLKIGVLKEIHSELRTETQELHNLSQRVDVIPDNIISNQQWLLLAQLIVMTTILLISCVQFHHTNLILERKLNAIQATLSSQNKPIISQQSSTAPNSSPKHSAIATDHEEGTIESSQKTNVKEHPPHARSLSFTSVTDLHRQAENIGDLSRTDLKYLVTNGSRNGFQSNSFNRELSCSRSQMSMAGSPLASCSLTSLSDRRCSEVSYLLKLALISLG